MPMALKLEVTYLCVRYLIADSSLIAANIIFNMANDKWCDG